MNHIFKKKRAVIGGVTMTAEDLIELEIEIIAKDTTEADLDRMTRNLLKELREYNIESIKLASVGIAPEGSKGDPVTVGAMALVVLPAVLPSIVGFIQTWVMRKQNRSVKFRGNGIEFEGSPEELEKLLKRFEKGKKKK